MTRIVIAVFLVLNCLNCALFRAPRAEQPPVEAQLRIVLRWRTETESDAFGYFIYRNDAPDAEPRCINENQPLLAAGTSIIPRQYVYFDLDLEPAKPYYYKILAKDLDGSSKWIVGGDQPVSGTPKPISAAELEEIKLHGTAYGYDLH